MLDPLPDNPVSPPAERGSAAPELLAPAGDRECIRAAVENGADAVYFGLNHGFNARARAANMGLEELADIMRFLRLRGVKGYVTLNTLVFADELPMLEHTVRQVAAAGVNAVLVQDLGLALLIREICPELPLHASTQMTLTDAGAIRVAESLGIERVVLARELSLDEIRKIRVETSMPLEVFVHGALCVAYSGQCLTSESFGGRSANRGQCAQACRLPYDLICDGRDVPLGDVKYLLSPQDLAAYAHLPELLEAGVCSFKIEGRLKTPEYVANITRQYRRALDAALQGKTAEFTATDLREMELSFSRGFSSGWLEGCDHKRLVPGLSSAKRGVLIGIVAEVGRDRVTVELQGPLASGDGVVLEGDREHNEEQGGRIFEVTASGVRLTGPADSGAVVELAFGRGTIDWSKIRVGQKLWKTDDPHLTTRLRKSFTSPDPVRKTRLDLRVNAAVGRPLTIAAHARSGARASVASGQPLQAARKHPLTADLLREQLGRLGGTVYELGDVCAEISGEPMVPLSVLGQLRHELVRQLDASLEQPRPRSIAGEPVLPQLRTKNSRRLAGEDLEGGPLLRVLCRSLAQVQQVIGIQPASVYADFQDIREYREAVKLARAAGMPLFLATPRIQKPGERGVLMALAKHAPDGILARNLSALAFFRQQQIACVTDFSLNVTNDLALQFLLQHGAERVTVSYDLNRDQLLDLVQATPDVSAMEVVVHQHMPMFHMEHCVFCAVLSPGTNKTNCGRPCDVHRVELRDRIGMEHPLKADVGCRNTLFNAVPQSAAEVIPELKRHGIRHFRLELLDESAEEVRTVIEQYRALLAGHITGKEVWRRLRAANRVGITRGTLEERRNPLAIL